MTNTVITYPVPAYANVPIHTEYYIPNVFIISAISFGITTTVTTSINHNYVIGQQVRLLIPSKFGSRGLNEKSGIVINIPAPNQVVIDLSSLGIDPFIASPTFVMFQPKTPAQIIAIGDFNNGKINASGRVNTGTYIPGSFINISPL